MKIQYVCECCDTVVNEIEFSPGLSGVPGSLTDQAPHDIINLNAGEATIVFDTLCEDCRETLYGGHNTNFYNGPVLH